MIHPRDISDRKKTWNDSAISDIEKMWPDSAISEREKMWPDSAINERNKMYDSAVEERNKMRTGSTISDRDKIWPDSAIIDRNPVISDRKKIWTDPAIDEREKMWTPNSAINERNKIWIDPASGERKNIWSNSINKRVQPMNDLEINERNNTWSNPASGEREKIWSTHSAINERHKMSTDSASSLMNNQNSHRVICFCGAKAAMVTAWTDENPSRRFFWCANYWKGAGCKFFEWYDPPICDRAKSLIPKLMKKKNELKTQNNELQKQLIRRKRLEFLCAVLIFAICVYLLLKT